MDTNESLLRAVLATVARSAFSQDEIYRIVAPTVNSKKQIDAYNLCDGLTAQADIGKRAKLDKSNLSKLIGRWVDAGIIFRIGKDQLPLHLYPINKTPNRGE